MPKSDKRSNKAQLHEVGVALDKEKPMTVFSEQPAIVELFGHSVIAGLITEEEHFGTTFLRVDVPEIDGKPAFTKFYGSGAIYAITPTDHNSMLAAVQSVSVRPVSLYILPDRQLLEPERDDERKF